MTKRSGRSCAFFVAICPAVNWLSSVVSTYLYGAFHCIFLSKLAYWMNFAMSTYLYGAFECVFILYQAGFPAWINILYLPEYQGTACSKEARNLKFRWLQLNMNQEQFSSQTNTPAYTETGQLIELCCDYLSARCIFLSCHAQFSEWIHTLSSPECQRTPFSK